MEIIVLIVVLAVLVVGGATFAATRNRSRGPELEPPGTPILKPSGGGTAVEDRVEEVPADLVERVEEALAEVGPDVEVPTVVELEPGIEAVIEPDVEVEAPRRPRFRDRLSKARGLFAGYLQGIRGRKVSEETWEDLEEVLIRADVGVATTNRLLEALRARAAAESVTEGAQLLEILKEDLKKSLASSDRGLRFEPGPPNVWLFVGVNGVGKTTTIGKVAKAQAALGRTVVMAAGDTFRAAAADQLQVWAERAGADIVRGAEGADPGSIVFDAISAAAARKKDLVLGDTAGRLHTKVNLMEELKKVRRVADKAEGQVTEVLLVLDATTGQNGLVQAKQFTEAVELTGVVLTKLDGTAKGGIALAIQTELGIPIKLVGLGETADDLVDFDPDEFVDALFSE
ncbi:MAG TPA: signal recognition particle-docking protein FtsY [Acidimicrobiales bacterium]|nr:signal recognition particle-docking protein FtsY [Acidimicrobiales bacterium]